MQLPACYKAFRFGIFLKNDVVLCIVTCGIWKVLTKEEIINACNNCGNNGGPAANKLTELADERWMEKYQSHNASAIVVKLGS